MEMNGSRVIAADRETVWKHLNSAETLQACIPGCEELEGSPEDGFAATVKQKVGPVKATFKGEVTLEDVNAPESYKLVGEGKGGVAGFAKGGAVVKLTEVEGGTELSYDVEAKVGGKLAQLGNRIVNGFAKKMVDSFFERFEAVVEGRDPNAVKEEAEG
ncbi:CoxG family protein [Maritimibacter sp. DP1N21-5]|uniref:CoxG family protein n=1 Tax=Maritimibacter sp. DP1N21-5 TaxID=2836867 RepID=UPI001C456B53|nr:carbon monoxide dehydrogenase subunit G [Maritimibacter sp. DP1N21-5]MBV7409092.1 carbon monoxide dehydrogenase subunit G [Maritimibacter sp. DP1N21-5]